MGEADTQKSGVLWQQGCVHAVAAAFKAAMGVAYTWVIAHCAAQVRIHNVLWRQIAAATVRTGARVSCGFVLRIRDALWRRGRRRYGESGKLLLWMNYPFYANPGVVWRGRGPSDLNPQDRLCRFEENFCEGQLAAREQKFIPFSLRSICLWQIDPACGGTHWFKSKI